MERKIKIGLTDDHYLVSKGINAVINDFDDFQMVLVAVDGMDLLSQLESATEIPDIILMDLSMPNMNGFDAMVNIAEHYPKIHCIVLTVNIDQESVARAIHCGAKAFLAKNCEIDLMYKTIISVFNQGYYYDSFVINSLNTYGKTNIEKGISSDLIPLNNFTPIELQFIRLACSDLHYKEIADKMNLSTRTVEGYKENISKKIGVKSRYGLILYAIKNKIFILE